MTQLTQTRRDDKVALHRNRSEEQSYIRMRRYVSSALDCNSDLRTIRLPRSNLVLWERGSNLIMIPTVSTSLSVNGPGGLFLSVREVQGGGW
jgi:hypothetical protein